MLYEVITLVQGVYDQYQNGDYTLDEAKKIAADIVRSLSYGLNGYFWIDQSDGTNVVLLGKDTEGTNRMNAVDANNFRLVEALINTAVV